jgi:hypothetical protein
MRTHHNHSGALLLCDERLSTRQHFGVWLVRWFYWSPDTGLFVETVSLGFVMRRCGVRMQWQRSGEGQVGRVVLTDRLRWRADVRLGSTNQTTGWPAAVADTWDTDKLKLHGGGHVRAMLLAGGLVVCPQNQQRQVSWVWASKPGRRSWWGRTARGGIAEIASERGYRWGGAVPVGSEKLELDHSNLG